MNYLLSRNLKVLFYNPIFNKEANLFKVIGSRDFHPWFFVYQSTASRSLIYTLKHRIWSDFSLSLMNSLKIIFNVKCFFILWMFCYISRFLKQSISILQLQEWIWMNELLNTARLNICALNRWIGWIDIKCNIGFNFKEERAVKSAKF
jgi:hypothetical protein